MVLMIQVARNGSKVRPGGTLPFMGGTGERADTGACGPRFATQPIGMQWAYQVAILMPIAVGAIAVLCTIFIHALALGATVNFFRYERRRGRAGAGLGIDLTILILVMAFAFVAHLIEMALWATLLVICGEFQHFGIAFYHSAGNYTTLGSGGILMTPSWRLLGPLEAANGALMFGVSTAMIFAVIVRLMQAHFADLRS